MFFKIALQNVRKSIKDYTVYFLTLTFGVCLFYVFNSMDSQQAMMVLTHSQKQIMDTMLEIIGIISVFISVILGFLIVYANQFLIKRRKKELGIYMVLGMKKSKISAILILETMIIGLISLAAGIIIGIFGSQGLAVITAKMFLVEMKEFTFKFSSAAMVKSIVYFGIIYMIVIFFNTISISRYKLIDLLTASKKNQKFRIKKLWICVVLFIISLVCIGEAYNLIIGYGMISMGKEFYEALVLGSVGTFLFFLSLSGFLLKVVQSCKSVYLRGLNMFVMRQINSRITTTFISMSLICIMLLIAIGVLSTGVGLADAMGKDIKADTPFDMSLRLVELEGKAVDSDKILNQMAADGIDITGMIKDTYNFNLYEIDGVIYDRYFTKVDNGDFLAQEIVKLISDSNIQFIAQSEYNRIAKYQGLKELDLKDGQVAIQSNYKVMKDSLAEYVKSDATIEIEGKTYTYYPELIQTVMFMGAQTSANIGGLIVPDDMLKNAKVTEGYANFTFNCKDENEIEDKSEEFKENEEKIYRDKTNPNRKEKPYMHSLLRTNMYVQMAGLSVIATYIAIYVGIIFLITCSAILSLQQLSDGLDNQERYRLLRKIGVKESDITKSIFMQIFISFCMPLTLALVHSYVGIKVANEIVELIGYNDAIKGTAAAVIGIVIIYGGYMLATFAGCKAMNKK